MKILAYFQILLLLSSCASWFGGKSSVPEWLPGYQGAEVECGDWPTLPDELKNKQFVSLIAGGDELLAIYWQRSGTQVHAFDSVDSSFNVLRDEKRRFVLPEDEQILFGAKLNENRVLLSKKSTEDDATVIVYRWPDQNREISIPLPANFDELVSVSPRQNQAITILLRDYAEDSVKHHIVNLSPEKESIVTAQLVLTLAEKDIDEALPVRMSWLHDEMALSYFDKKNNLVVKGAGEKKHRLVLSLGEEVAVDFEVLKLQGGIAWLVTSRDENNSTITRAIFQPSNIALANKVVSLNLDGRELITPKLIPTTAGFQIWGTYIELGESHLVGFDTQEDIQKITNFYGGNWAGSLHLKAMEKKSTGQLIASFNLGKAGDRVWSICGVIP